MFNTYSKTKHITYHIFTHMCTKTQHLQITKIEFCMEISGNFLKLEHLLKSLI